MLLPHLVLLIDVTFSTPTSDFNHSEANRATESPLHMDVILNPASAGWRISRASANLRVRHAAKSPCSADAPVRECWPLPVWRGRPRPRTDGISNPEGPLRFSASKTQPRQGRPTLAQDGSPG